jgi:hypothetical protein
MQYLVVYLIIYSVMPQYFIPFFSHGEESNSCLNSSCGVHGKGNYIQLYHPSQGAQVLMNQTRVRYDIHKAPIGAYSRIFVDQTALEIYGLGWKSTTFVDDKIDLAVTIEPGFRTLKVWKNSDRKLS